MNVVVNIATILLALLSLTHCCCSLALAHQDVASLSSSSSLSDQRCESKYDCTNPDKICHENKCICLKERPIEDLDQDRCLPQALIGEPCVLESQCLVDSVCLDGFCTCGIDAVSVYNPSSKIFYCQPKRRLEEKCNSDPQCPQNAFCAVRGCLCQNGYSAQNVSQINGIESAECLPKLCSSEDDCEPFHTCDDNKCKCLPTHFDISRAKCYKFGGKAPSGDQASAGNDSSPTTGGGNGQSDDFISILKDLTSMTSDNLWLVLIGLIILSLLLLILILSLLRKHYLGYCWTAHKKEYEPNTPKQPVNRDGHFDKNSINNKSFRRRNGEMDATDGNDSSTEEEDKSNLVSKRNNNNNNNNKGDFVAVDLSRSNNNNNNNDNGKQEDESQRAASSEQRRLQYHHQQGPLKSSTSTPV